MTIIDAIRILREVHEHHGNLMLVDDNGREIVGITMTAAPWPERLLGEQRHCLVSGRRRE